MRFPCLAATVSLLIPVVTACANHNTRYRRQMTAIEMLATIGTAETEYFRSHGVYAELGVLESAQGSVRAAAVHLGSVGYQISLNLTESGYRIAARHVPDDPGLPTLYGDESGVVGVRTGPGGASGHMIGDPVLLPGGIVQAR